MNKQNRFPLSEAYGFVGQERAGEATNKLMKSGQMISAIQKMHQEEEQRQEQVSWSGRTSGNR